MALIQLGPMVSGIKGSIGGTTYAKTRYGFIAKSKSQPVNPSSSLQTIVRGWMTEAVANWKTTLSDTEIDTWIHGAQLHKRSHIGIGFELSGINLYCACYVALKKAGETPPSECTIFEGAPEIILPTIATVVASGKKEITAWTGTITTQRLLVYATNGVSIGIRYKSVPFVFTDVVDSTFIGPDLIDVVYPASGVSYSIFYGYRVVDTRGAISSLLSQPNTGTIV